MFSLRRSVRDGLGTSLILGRETENTPKLFKGCDHCVGWLVLFNGVNSESLI